MEEVAGGERINRETAVVGVDGGGNFGAAVDEEIVDGGEGGGGKGEIEEREGEK